MRTGRKWLVCILLITLIGLCLAWPVGQAQSPVPINRYQWVKGLDDLYPREHGPYLSRSLASIQTSAISLPGPSFAVDFQHYPTSEEIVIFLSQLQSAYPRLVEVITAGQSWQGRPIVAVQVANRAAGDPDSRPALYVDAQHHAREAISSQVALYFVWHLVTHYGVDPLVTHLLDTRMVYAIPCVNPDGNDIFLGSDQRQRRTANPAASDDDGDGLYDEDGRENGGFGTYEVYHYTFDAAWVEQHPDEPLAQGWQAHLLDRAFVGLFDGEGGELPQVDDDADGRTGEDPPGGVDANRNYDSHWELGNASRSSELYRGPAAFSEPETKVVRDYVLGRPNIVTALSLHSGSDLLLHPWGWSTEAELPDRFWYELLSRKGSQLTEVNGFRGAAHAGTAVGLYTASGTAMDWLYEGGIWTWTPEVYAASSLAFAQRIAATNTFTVGVSLGEAYNPLPDQIALIAERWLPWSLYLLAAAPNAEVTSVSVAGNQLQVTIANDGLLPLQAEATVQTSERTYTATVDYLSASGYSWSVPLPAAVPAGATAITLTAQSLVQGAPGPAQVEALELEILGQTVTTVRGRPRPFVDLSSSFGGWFAPDGWDVIGQYHLGPRLLRAHFLPLIAGGG